MVGERKLRIFDPIFTGMSKGKAKKEAKKYSSSLKQKYPSREVNIDKIPSYKRSVYKVYLTRK